MASALQDKLHKKGLCVMGVPKTIDNDIESTGSYIWLEYRCLGFATECIDRLHSGRCIMSGSWWSKSWDATWDGSRSIPGEPEERTPSLYRRSRTKSRKSQKI